MGVPSRVLDDDFARHVAGAAGGMANYNVAPSGDRFVMVEDLSSAGQRPTERGQVHVVLNWFTEMRERMGGD